MKKILLFFLTLFLLISMVGCINRKKVRFYTNKNYSEPYTYDEVAFKEKYPGYYIEYDFDEMALNITNYNPSADTYPDNQELIQYGYCGMHSSSLIYFIYIMDINSYCYLEIDAKTLEIVHEDDIMYQDSNERSVKIEQLIEMIDYIVKSL